MTDRPILFSAPMIQALIAGRKTQTRRIAKVRRDINFGCEIAPNEYAAEVRDLNFDNAPYAPGDRLWVRETFCQSQTGHETAGAFNCFYRATDPDVEGVDDGDGYSLLNKDGSLKSPWKPGIHMPRWASRITLNVTNVRVQRLQDVSEDDARAEGVGREFEIDVATFVRGSFDPEKASTHYLGFKHTWNRIHGTSGYKSWAANPWVIALTFRVHHGNIDALSEAA